MARFCGPSSAGIALNRWSVEPLNRVLERELLDDLAPGDPAAQHSRNDLRRLNSLMAHARLIAGELDPAVRTVCDLGGGDGNLMLSVARHARCKNVDLTIVDRVDIVSEQTRHAFNALGWRVSVAEDDVRSFLQSDDARCDSITANLFLHHFDDESLRDLLSLAAARCSSFVACEPRRSSLAAIASRCVLLVGCNHVTRHDAVKSVRAGFTGNDLTLLWPARGWHVREKKAGLFSHLFTAKRALG
jgi:hypothetical protein